jgi:hypothetical protein
VRPEAAGHLPAVHAAPRGKVRGGAILREKTKPTTSKQPLPHLGKARSRDAFTRESTRIKWKRIHGIASSAVPKSMRRIGRGGMSMSASIKAALAERDEAEQAARSERAFFLVLAAVIALEGYVLVWFLG